MTGKTQTALFSFAAGVALAAMGAGALAGHPAIVGSLATLAAEAAASLLWRAFPRTTRGRSGRPRATEAARPVSALERDLTTALANFGASRGEAKAWAAAAVDRVGPGADLSTALRTALEKRAAA